MKRISTGRASKITGVHVATIRRWILAGTLPAVRVGSRYKVWRADVEALVRQVEVTGRARGAELPATAREREAERRRVEEVCRRAGLATG